jgi:hypothetical protein
VNLSVFSFKSILPTTFVLLGPPKVFRSLGGCGTRPFFSIKKDSNILAVPILSLRSTGIPSFTQAALAKISIRSKIRQIPFIIFSAK